MIRSIPLTLSLALVAAGLFAVAPAAQAECTAAETLTVCTGYSLYGASANATESTTGAFAGVGATTGGCASVLVLDDAYFACRPGLPTPPELPCRVEGRFIVCY